jgi:O-acetyl-ADP-ribose deacetylase (regulator of RNase III)
MIRYIVGDATSPQGEGPKLLVHICNDLGLWGKGFVLAISRRWGLPAQRYRAWHRGETPERFALGEVQLVQVEPMLWIVNLVGQHGVASKARRDPPIRYDAVRAGLARVREHATRLGASVHMPRIGSGLAGARWEEISSIIEDELSVYGLDVTVYDLKPHAKS